MIAALLAVSAVAAPGTLSPPAVEDEVPAFGALGPRAAGVTSLTATAGRPFYSLRVAHGLWDAMDVAAAFDYSPDGVYRPAIETRIRAFRAGPTQLVARLLIGRAFTTSAGMANTNDGELALQLAVAPFPRGALFVECSLLGTTDFTRERTAGFVQGAGGIAIALPGGFSLLGSLGILQGVRGHRTVGSSGASVRF
jgi:hypothetical protein